jgi:PAS domain S-box-containing protein
MRAFEEARRQQSTFAVEHRIRNAAGDYRWFLVRGEPYHDPQTGKPIKWFGASVDIHDRKLAEAGLRQLNETLEEQVAARSAERDRLWNLSQDMLARANYAGMMSAVSPAWQWVLGWSEEELLTRGYAAFMHPEDMPATLEAISRMGESGLPTRFENRIATKAGGWKPIEWTVAPEPDGESFIAVGRDLSTAKAKEAELRAAEQARRDADALYRAYFENTPEALFVIGITEDGDFLVEEINPAHEASVGLALADIKGKRIEDILPPDTARKVVDSYRQLVSSDGIVQYRELFDLNGEQQHWDTSLVPMRDGAGRIVRIIGSSRNVTRQVVAEQTLRQTQKMEAMGSLTGGVAHDFNNLLTPIIGSLDMLSRKEGASEREKRLLDGALQSAEKARTLVQRLLAFARRQPLQPVAIDLRQLVEGMVDLVRSTIGPTIRLITDIADELPPAKAEANQVEMALLNLAVNARDAMPDGGDLKIALTKCSVTEADGSTLTPGDYVCLQVIDSGIGMDPDTLRRAVEPFFSTKGIGKGTGLGLSMVHGLAAQLGGELKIDSTPGQGTSITLLLPASRDPLGHQQEAAGKAIPAPATRGRVLLVDDEDLVRATTADMLSELGWTVVEASDATSALQKMATDSAPDLLITDHLMPGMSGAELAQQVRAGNAAMPILIVSGYAESDGIAPDLPRLNKPFRKDELAATINALFESTER